MRSAFVSAIVVASLAACSVTSPKPLPPHRQRAGGPAASADYPRPADFPIRAEPPLVDERYLAPVLAADLAGLYPLVYFMVQPDKSYYALPSLLIPPLIHVAYGQTDKALTSVIMRAAMVGVVYGAGRLAEQQCDNSNAFICLPLGPLMLGNAAIVTVVVLDSLLLAKRRRPDRAWSRMRMLPSVSAGQAGETVYGVAGRF